MQISQCIHAIRIPFEIVVAPGVRVARSVYSYLVFGDGIALVDSGVSGAEAVLFEYIRKSGRDPREISTLVLTHSHPDHVGSAKAIRDAAGCEVWAHAGEKDWIEDTEKQFRERPVPGFHDLVGGPVAVARLLADGEIIDLAGRVGCRVIHTPGHSAGSISLFCEEEKALFSGDAVPLPGDMPIYDDIGECMASMERLARCGEVETLLSSWEAPVRGREAVAERMEAGLAYLRRIHETVLKAGGAEQQDPMELCRHVVRELGLPPGAANPLTARAFTSSLKVSS
ncbi:MAG: MBL fold metallo-hydrolase [Syntrophaceae bacterium]|nr:MBL fold metallo-hydrolase [Syntrophaceae bacterium]